VCPTASDGHFLKVLWCPVGKGDPKWQAAPSRLFLGIHHTAIVVGDTAASLRYYRDVLGAGRPAPVDLKANDLAYWQIHFVVSDAEAASSAARAARGAINPGVVALTDGRLGFRHGALACDRDGHAVELAEP
jgi:catechol 2,3-dioxygenase-like lactoylglutathione lyase family enzyme